MTEIRTQDVPICIFSDGRDDNHSLSCGSGGSQRNIVPGKDLDLTGRFLFIYKCIHICVSQENGLVIMES